MEEKRLWLFRSLRANIRLRRDVRWIRDFPRFDWSRITPLSCRTGEVPSSGSWTNCCKRRHQS